MGEVLSQIERDRIVDSRLVSTAHTVMGAALADLEERQAAFQHARRARAISEGDPEFNKTDFYPYSLLGRLYFESHDFTMGEDCFDEATKRGASLEEKKKTLQGRMYVMPLDRAALLAELLLEHDRQTYDWAEAFIGRPATKQEN
jgi:hypothetical protein